MKHDLIYALRQLRSNPGFALTAVLSLALGIGANTAIFSLLDRIVLRLLPVQNPRELVQLRAEGARPGGNNGDGLHTFSYPAYAALRDRNTVLSGLTGQSLTTVSLLADDRSEMIRMGYVAGNFFQVLGVQAHQGRLLTPDDDRIGNRSPVVILQYDFWRNRFAGSRDVIGATIRVNGAPYTVIGIAASGFQGVDPAVVTHVWVPVTGQSAAELNNERYAWFYLFGRLKPGVTIGQAQAAMRVLYRQRQQEELQGDFFRRFPETRERFLRQNFTLIPAGRGQSFIRLGFERPLIVLQWLVGMVLLIACTNVANLLLARAAARQREVAIRGALGASRGRIARQFFVESAILALAGGGAGLLLSSWLTRSLVRILPFDPTNLALSTSPDMRILVFTTAITLLTALLFGLFPAFRGARVALGTTLKEEAGAIAGSHGHVRLRKLFVGLQVALSCLLLIGAGLFARTFQNLRSVDLGFNTENVVMFTVRPATMYDEPRKQRVFRSLMESLAMVPGVKAAGANSIRLLMGGRWDSQITIPGVEPKDGNHPWSFFNAVTPGYFEALGIPVKAGRDLRWSDWDSGRKICLVNEALVNEYFGNASPVGRIMAQGAKQTPDMEIVGVFANTRYDDVRGAIPRQVFVSMGYRLRFVGSINVFARIQGDPRRVMPQLREQVRRTDANLVLYDMRTLDDQLNMRLSNERLLGFLSVGFAMLACLLAVVGMHGVLSFVVTRRSREIGIRLALGAGQGRVIRLIAREMAPVIAFGLAVGVSAGLLCGRFVESQLFGVIAADPQVFVISIGALLAAALASAFAPAWRASRIDPVRALRQ